MVNRARQKSQRPRVRTPLEKETSARAKRAESRTERKAPRKRPRDLLDRERKGSQAAQTPRKAMLKTLAARARTPPSWNRRAWRMRMAVMVMLAAQGPMVAARRAPPRR